MNNLPFTEIEKIMKEIKGNKKLKKMNEKDKAKTAAAQIKERANELGEELILRK